MKKRISSACFSCFLFLNSNAQNSFNLIDSATLYFCEGDTATSIFFLEKYAEEHPAYLNTIIVLHRLGQLYIHAGDYPRALNKFKPALDIQPKQGHFKEPEKCNLFLKENLSSAKADVCVTVSQFYKDQGDYEKAFEYLELADTRLFPYYGGCANGMIMYQAYLSLFFADLYTETGDTTKAINRLLESFVQGLYYSDQVTEKLKKLLQLKYTKHQINQEVSNAISTINRFEAKDGSSDKTYYFTLFNKHLRLPYGNRKQQKRFLRSHLNQLKS